LFIVLWTVAMRLAAANHAAGWCASAGHAHG
jgi:hypothetical protein